MTSTMTGGFIEIFGSGYPLIISGSGLNVNLEFCDH